jgi:hypothetical protein
MPNKCLTRVQKREYNHIFMISPPQMVTVAGPAGTGLPRPSPAPSDRSRAEHAIELQADCDCPLAADWHTSSIRLAGRIFGDFQKRMAFLNDNPR